MINQGVIESDKIQARQDRFMSLATPVRLGELAESLAFAKAASNHPNYPQFLIRALNESVNFIDWMAAAVDSEIQTELAELRSHLTGWLRDVHAIGDDPLKRASVVTALDAWSQKILDRSGLAEYDDWQREFDYPPGIRAAAESLA